MRDFFINSFEKLVGVIIALMSVGVVLAALAIMAGGMGAEGSGPAGPVAGLLFLIGGALYVVFFGGIMYLALGVYHNTRRTAEAVEKLLSK